MVTKFGVPKFITIEDKLAGLLTFKQLFALLGAFLLSFFVFKINQLLGLITAFLSFGLAFLFTFVYINGKPFMFILPDVLDLFFKSRKFVWKRLERLTYKEVEIPEAEEIVAPLPKLQKRERKIYGDVVTLEIDYPEVAPHFREKLTISFNEPIATQAEEISRIIHRHLVNPKNPYRLFPYIKFYRTLK